MKKTIVVYYSKNGSNRFLAEKIASSLRCDVESIRPRLNVFLLFLMKVNFGIKPLRHSIAEYDRVILCGPIWMGRLIPPLRSFIMKYRGSIKSLVFVTCCGSTFAKKDEKFGHGLVFNEVKSILNSKCTLCQAFPVGLVLPNDQKEASDAFMKAHLNEETFKGEVQALFDSFMSKVKEGE